MARSYKTVPGWTDNGLHRRFAKRQANKRIRQTPDVPNGRAFRKISETWDICDYRFLHFERALRFEEYCRESETRRWNPLPWQITWYRAYMK